MNKTKQKVIALFAVTTLTTGMLSGCSLLKPTTESVLKDYKEKAQTVTSADMDMEIKFEMGVEAQDVSTSLEVDAEANVLYTKEDEENYKTYTQSDIKFSLLGVSKSEESEIYEICDDGDVTSYTKKKDDTEWTKKKKGEKYSLFASTGGEMEKLLVLQEETEKVGDRECYVLKGTATLEDIPTLSKNTDIGVEFDEENIKFDITLKIDKKDKTPVELSYIIDEESLTDEVEDALGEQLGGAKVKIETYELNFKMNSFNEEIEIDEPDELKDAKEEESVEAGLFDNVEPEVEEPEIEEEPDLEEPEIEEETTSKDLEESGFSYKEYITTGSSGKICYLLVTNNNSSDNSVMVSASFLLDGEVVGTDDAYLDIEAGKYCVADFYPEVEFDAVEYTCENYEYEDGELLGKDQDVFCSIEDDLVTGSVTNEASVAASYPQVHILLLDEDGDIIEHQYTFVESDVVQPGESSDYTMYIEHTDYDSYLVYATAQAD